jgi:hypothetical protein
VLWGMVITVIGVWTAAAFGYVGTGVTPIVVAIAVTLGAALVGALQFDRSRNRGDISRYVDNNEPNYYAPMGNETWQVPTSYIDHGAGGGPRRGVDDDDRRPRR